MMTAPMLRGAKASRLPARRAQSTLWRSHCYRQHQGRSVAGLLLAATFWLQRCFTPGSSAHVTLGTWLLLRHARPPLHYESHPMQGAASHSRAIIHLVLTLQTELQHPYHDGGLMTTRVYRYIPCIDLPKSLDFYSIGALQSGQFVPHQCKGGVITTLGFA